MEKIVISCRSSYKKKKKLSLDKNYFYIRLFHNNLDILVIPKGTLIMPYYTWVFIRIFSYSLFLLAKVKSR